MKSKPAVGLFVLIAVGLVTWSLTSSIGVAVAGGRDAFLSWREANLRLFYGVWLAEVLVIGLPLLWFVGRRMGAYAAQQDAAAVAARGVGRLAGRALRGDRKAVDHLLQLLGDSTPAVRYQAARALAILDDNDTNEALFRAVRYWDVEHKLGLVDVLRRTMDLRTVRLLRVLAEDRNPHVSRKARTGLAIVSSRSANIDDFIARRRRQAQAKRRKEARRQAWGGRAAEPARELPAGPPGAPATAASPGPTARSRPESPAKSTSD